MMPIEYGTRVLEQASSAAYIRSILAQDWHGLSRLLAREFENACGRIETFLPTACTTAAAHKFQTGGVTSTAISHKWIAGLTQEFLRGSPDRLLLAQEPLSQRGDPVQDWEKPLIHYFGTDVYYTCTKDSPRDQLDKVFRFATALPWSLAIWTSLLAAEHDRLLSAEVNEDQLLTLCRNTEAIVVGSVYDGEGYLIWKRDPIPRRV